MSFSYSGDPSSSLLDEVRFLIQDTDAKDFFISDEEINYLIKNNGSAIQSSFAACTVLIAKFARLCDEQTGRQTVYASQMQENYIKLRKEIELQLAKKSTNVFFSGTKIQKQFSDNEGDNYRAWRK